jgi:CRP/FNR family cyclic AMP-dependent transcriptional regulator
MVAITLFRHSKDGTSLESGEVLFRQGDPGDVMYGVVEGAIVLSKDGSVLEEVGPGGVLGEMALIDPAPRAATATAGSTSRVVAIDKEHFTFLVQEHPTFALQVMQLMAERLRRSGPSTTAETSDDRVASP